MVARGRLTADDAERLLSVLDRDRSHASEKPIQPQHRGASFLRVLVTANDDDDEHETVDMRIPIATLKAGLHLPGLLPKAVADGINRALAEKDIDLDVHRLKHRDIDPLVQALRQMEINVTTAHQRVLIYVE